MLICGIDEAGRGPVIGPLVIACVVVDSKGKEELKKLNVRDSKRVSVSRRKKLEPLIKDIAIEWKLIKITPREIDRLRKKISLNVIEAKKMAEVVSSLEHLPDKLIVDAADAVAENFGNKIIGYLKDADIKIPSIVSEHRADDKYVEVGAASILAKVERDRDIDLLKDKYGEIGSGYPADELTQKFLHELMQKGELPDFVRKSWNTVNRKKQMRLNAFLE